MRAARISTSYTSVFRRLRPSARSCEIDHRIDLCHRPDPYARCWHRGDVDQSPAVHRRWCRFLVGADRPWWWRPHGTSHNFTLTGMNFLSVPSHCSYKLELDHSISQVLTTSRGFYQNWGFKSLQVQLYPRWLVPLPWCHTPQLLVMHVVFRFLLRIFI